jgi:hypothetical protein
MNLHALAKTGHEWSLEHTLPLPLWKENESSSRKDCTTKASDDAAIETFVKAFPNSLSNLLERLHHQQYNGLYMVL